MITYVLLAATIVVIIVVVLAVRFFGGNGDIEDYSSRKTPEEVQLEKELDEDIHNEHDWRFLERGRKEELKRRRKAAGME